MTDRCAAPDALVEKGTKMNTRAGAILLEASSIVDGARNQTHGAKEQSFLAIAGLWEVYLRSRPAGISAGIRGADVAAMMVLMKFARSLHGEHIADHAVDAAGYAAIWGELRENGLNSAAARGEEG
jgi:hypothetical protein